VYFAKKEIRRNSEECGKIFRKQNGKSKHFSGTKKNKITLLPGSFWILIYLMNTPFNHKYLGIQSYDIISTLQFLGMIKYWRGKHIILKKEDVINEYLER